MTEADAFLEAIRANSDDAVFQPSSDDDKFRTAVDGFLVAHGHELEAE